jgi:hypothetical protein
MRFTLALTAFIAGALHAAEFDTSSFSRVQDDKDSLDSKISKEDGSATESVKPADFKNLESRISGFSKIVRTARTPEEKSRFLTTLAVLELQKGRALAQDPGSAATPDERKETFLQAAHHAEAITVIPKQTKRTVAYAHYMAGLGYAGADDNAGAEKHFVRLLEVWPQAPYAAGVALHLADLYAAGLHHDKTVALLKKYASQFSPGESSVARLKMSKSLAAMKDFAAAEAELKALIRDPKAVSVNREAIKDLANVATQAHTDPEVQEMADQLFAGKPEKKSAFLTGAWSNFQKAGMNHQVSRVFSSLMQMAATPEKRLRLWLDETRANRKPYASSRHYSGVYSIEQEWNGLPADKVKGVKQELGAEVMAEIEMMIRSFSDTYSDHEKNQEKLPKDRLSMVLREVAAFHIKNFPDSKNRSAVYALMLDVCAGDKDAACVYETSAQIQSDASVGGLHGRAYAERVRSLVNLDQGDSARWSGKLVSELEEYVSNPKAAGWSEYAKLLSEKYVERRAFDRAIKLLNQLYAREKNEDSYFRLLQARVGAGQSDKIAVETLPPDFEASARIQKLVRTALGEYLGKLVERNETDKAVAKLAGLDAENRSSAEIQPALTAVAYSLMRQGQFEKASQIIPPATAKNKSMHYESVIARLGASYPVSAAELTALPPDKRVYVFKLLAVSRPEVVVSYLDGHQKLEADLIKPCMLAFQVKQQTADPQLTNKQKQLLGMKIPEGGDPLVRAENLALNIRFPAEGNANLKSGRKLDSALNQVRKVRTLVQSGIKGRNHEAQIRVLAMAAHLEEQAAAAIEKNPNGLSSHEFRMEAEEFIKEQNHIETAEKAKSSIGREPAATSQNWPWPDSGLKSKIVAYVSSGQVTAALLMLDLNHEKGMVSENDYHTFRAGCLLSDTRNDVLQGFACDELKQAGLSVPKICEKSF